MRMNDENKRMIKRLVRDNIVSIKTLAKLLRLDNLRFHMSVDSETTIEQVLNYICAEYIE